MNWTEIEKHRLHTDGPPIFRREASASHKAINTGMTADAVNYPYSEEAFLLMCRLNGVEPSQAPRHFYYAANALQQASMHEKGQDIERTVTYAREPL